MESSAYRGSTSDFSRIDSGIIVKSPMKVWAGNPNCKKLEEEMEEAISFERRILEKLAAKLSVLNRYLGVHAPSKGILLTEASHGNLQAYINFNNATINNSLRWKRSVQAVEAVAYVHGQGVIHSDLRPENYLVQANGEQSGEWSRATRLGELIDIVRIQVK